MADELRRVAETWTRALVRFLGYQDDARIVFPPLMLLFSPPH